MHGFLHPPAENGMFLRTHWDFHDNSAPKGPLLPPTEYRKIHQNAKLIGLKGFILPLAYSPYIRLYSILSAAPSPISRPPENETHLAEPKNKNKRTAMRFALYIKTLGEDPVPLQHNSYRDYAVALQRQYEELRLQLGSKRANQARRSARREIKKLTLSLAAQGLVAPVPPTPPKLLRTGTSAPNSHDKWNCRRKLAHSNFLSALHHAHQLSNARGETNLHIYPCLVCNGIHIGHGKQGN
jgi:hypothetical protein